MVTYNGFNGNMGHSKMTKEQEYRYLVNELNIYEHAKQYYIHRLTSRDISKSQKHDTWLYLTGLIETWDIRVTYITEKSQTK